MNEKQKLALKILKDPKAYLENFTKIKGKEAGNLIPFKLNSAQLDLFNALNEYKRIIILKARQLGFCAQPSQKVLTADLRWVAIDDLRIGDRIISVDEYTPGGKGVERKMRTAVVEAKADTYQKAYKLLLRDGAELVLTAEHKMLSKQRGGPSNIWRAVKDFVPGDVMRRVTKTWGPQIVDDGWMAGMLDGEGSLAKKSRTGGSINVSQVPGPVWEAIENYLSSEGYAYRVEIDKRKPGESSKFGSKVVKKAVVSRLDEMFRLIGKTRPHRFIGKDFWEGKTLPNGGWVEVESIEELSTQRMVDVQTSAGTYILEGFVSHNSTGVVGWFYWNTVTTPGTNTAIIGYNSELTAELLEKVKTFLRTTPPEIRPTVHYNSKYEISFPAIDSKIIVLPSTENVGRGYTLHNCLGGETNVFLPGGKKEMIRNLNCGDYVIDGNGVPNEVLAVVEKTTTKRMFLLATDGCDGAITITEDHKVQSVNDEGMPSWIKAGDLRVGSPVGFPDTDGDYPGINISSFKSKNGFRWSKIKRIAEIFIEPKVYDISLREKPHSFLTDVGIVSNCLMTEVAFWQKSEEKVASLLSTVPKNGRAVIESTPSSVGTKFHQLWVNENSWNKREYGWWWGYTKEEMDEKRLEINDDDRFNREFNLEFISGGFNVFDKDSIRRQRKNVKRIGDKVELRNGSFWDVRVEDDLTVYRPPEPGGIYTIGADVAEGVKGGNFSVAVVFDRITGEQVALFRGRPAPDIFGEMLDRWGRKYNCALMIPEVNNHGLTTVTILKQKGYPNLYYRPTKFDTPGQPVSDRLGWKTTTVTRPVLIDDFAAAVREQSVVIRSKEILDEMEVFILNEKTLRPEAMEGFNDDCLFAAGIGIQGFKMIYPGTLTQIPLRNFSFH